MDKTVGIILDESSIEILKKVDPLHRDSLINVGLALVSKTGYYKTLAGVNDQNELNDVASLDILDSESNDNENTKQSKNNKKEEVAVKKPVSSWDSF